MSGTTLYEICDELLALNAYVEATAEVNEGEIPDDLAARLDALELGRDTKITNIVRWVKNLEAEAAAIEIEGKKLIKRALSTINRAGSLRDYLAVCVGEGSKWSDATSKISWRASERTVIDDKAALPKQYIQVVVDEKPMLAEIKEAIKAGEIVPGAKIERHQSLQIN